MTAIAGNIPDYPAHAARRELKIMQGTFQIGSAGAVDTSPALAHALVDDPGITLTYASSTGVYTLVLPTVPIIGVPMVTFMSASDTIDSASFSAFSPSAGTGTIHTWKAHTLANPADNDTISVVYLAYTGMGSG